MVFLLTKRHYFCFQNVINEKEIRDLVEYALFDSENKNKSIEIGTVNKKQSEIILKNLGIDLFGCKRILNTNAIKHILKIHGSIKKEAKKGKLQ